jgi:hypothetical protein
MARGENGKISLDELQPNDVIYIEEGIWIAFRLQLWELKEGRRVLFKNKNGRICEIVSIEELLSEPETKKISKPTKVKRFTVFPPEEAITKVRGITIYKPILKYLLDNLTLTFKWLDIGRLLKKYYKDNLKRTVTRDSINTYAGCYRDFLESVGLSLEIREGVYELCSENKKKKILEHRMFITEVCE